MSAAPTAVPTLVALALLLSACSCSAQPPSAQDPAAGGDAAAVSEQAPGEEAPAAPADPQAPSVSEAPASPEPPAAPGGDGEFLAAEIATVGWDRFSNSPIVLLRELSTGQVVPIWVGTAEARAIAMALHEIEFPRPLTHDLMTNLIHDLGAELEEVRVHDLVDGTYLGLLRLRVEGREEPLLVDTRPSDGLALAARTGAAISIARKILDESPDYEFLAPESSDQVVRFSGLTLVAPNPELVERFALPERQGLVVTRAIAAAAEQGLRRGDLIVEVNGVVPVVPVDFLEAVKKSPVGAPLPLTYWREGAEHQLELIPELEPPPQEEDDRPKQVA